MELLIHLLSKSHRESFRLANLPYSNGTGTSAAKGIIQMLNTCLLLEKLLSFISLTSRDICFAALDGQESPAIAIESGAGCSSCDLRPTDQPLKLFSFSFRDQNEASFNASLVILSRISKGKEKN
jgi:hypothetical protein